ncbi:MAG TPA: aspartate dehydrogenase [Stellaceae bacterium]|nr:aspartate dehydrogenase [Stellaceae bacterium]
MARDEGGTLGVGIGGLGAIGLPVARWLAGGPAGLRLAAVSARDRERAVGRLAAEKITAPVMSLGELAARADIVIECVPAAAFDEVTRPAIAAGRTLLVLSAGALLERPGLAEEARRTGARIIVPSGALLGLDAVRAAAQGGIRSARLITRKPPGGLAGAPYLEQHRISVEGLSAPLRVFAGSAREGARGFPANVNVAAALALAGIGPDATELEIWADPTVTRNTHRIEIEAEAARFSMTIEGVPSAENPRTGRLTPLSVIACLRGLVDPLRIGT